MSDFKEWNDMRGEWKYEKMERATPSLEKMGLIEGQDYIWKTDYLIQITAGEKKWNFWPSTGKWRRNFGVKDTQKGIVKLKMDIKLYWEKKKNPKASYDPDIKFE